MYVATDDLYQKNQEKINLQTNPTIAVNMYKMADKLTCSFSCSAHRGKRRRRRAACEPTCLTPPTETGLCVAYRSAQLSLPTCLETVESIRKYRYHNSIGSINNPPPPKHMI